MLLQKGQVWFFLTFYFLPLSFIILLHLYWVFLRYMKTDLLVRLFLFLINFLLLVLITLLLWLEFEKSCSLFGWIPSCLSHGQGLWGWGKQLAGPFWGQSYPFTVYIKMTLANLMFINDTWTMYVDRLPWVLNRCLWIQV